MSDHADPGSDGDRVSARVRFDPDRPVSEVVVEALAEANDADLTALPPLYEAIDTDALDVLFDREGSGETDLVTSFTVGDQLVVVQGDGTVRVLDAATED